MILAAGGLHFILQAAFFLKKITIYTILNVKEKNNYETRICQTFVH